MPGLAHLPTQPRDVDKLRAACASSRDKQVQRTQKQRKPEVFQQGQQVLVQNNISKFWNICARILARRSHQGIETNSYIVRAQATGRQMVRSERNIRPVAGARTSPTGSDTDLGNDAHASAVLCSDHVSVLSQPTSILKNTLYEGSWLSPTQHTPAPTTEDSALTALQDSRQLPPKASIHTGTPSRTGHVQVSPLISVIDTSGFETLEKEEIRAFQRSKRNLKFKDEVHSKEINLQALTQTP